jgi:hypothetical protein
MVSRPRAPRGLSAPTLRRWRGLVDEFIERGAQVSAAALGALESWARAADHLAESEGRWVEAGRPATAPGYKGQERPHPLMHQVDRARRGEARTMLAIERMLRRVPRQSVPAGGRLLRRGSLSLMIRDGVEHVERDEKGGFVKWIDGDGVPVFKTAPAMYRESASGKFVVPSGAELETVAARLGVPVDAGRVWRRRMIEAQDRGDAIPPQITIARVETGGAVASDTCIS